MKNKEEYMENKEQLAADYEHHMKAVKASDTAAGGVIGGTLGFLGGYVGIATLGLSSGGAGFLLVGAAAGAAAIGAYITNRMTDNEIKAEKEAMKSMSPEEVINYKAKSVAEIQESIKKTRQEAESNSPSVTAAIATISIMGS